MVCATHSQFICQTYVTNPRLNPSLAASCFLSASHLGGYYSPYTAVSMFRWLAKRGSAQQTVTSEMTSNYDWFKSALQALV